MAKAYAGLDDRFSVLPWNAARDLFTFMRYPGMKPTDNESERMLHKAVIRRKIRQKMVNRRREDHVLHHNDMHDHVGDLGLNWLEKPSKVFWATWPLTVR